MEVAAAYSEELDNQRVVCRLCPANCRLKDGKRGICRCRFNRDGKLMVDNYGELVTLAVDPIEKKPLYHFYPGTEILSTGPNCCNLGCRHCQNWRISQTVMSTVYMTPERLTEEARRSGSIGVAFTYSEPMMWFEYVMDVAPLLRAEGLKVALVTNGYLNPKPLADLLTVTDAMNIDLKGMQDSFYKKICKGKLQPVLDNIRTVAQSDTHLEITNLIIPGQNDAEGDVRALVEFVASVSTGIPLHFSAYHPSYEATAPATPLKTLIAARELALESLKWVYLGNAPTDDGSDTRCCKCNEVLISRHGYRTMIQNLADGSCTACGSDAGVVQ